MVSQGAVNIEFFNAKLGKHRLVAAAIGFRNLGTELALAPFQAAVFEGVKRIFDLSH